MNIDQILLAIAVIITLTIIAGTIARKMNLGSTAALLLVGMALGPYSPRPLITDHVDSLQTVGEIGVILLMFLVGLGTQPGKLASMRRLFFGMGLVQYLLTTAAIAGLLLVSFHIQWQTAVLVGLALAMSSDVVAILSLEDHADTASPTGQAVTAVMIFHSFIAILVLALIPLLASRPGEASMPTVDTAIEVGAAIAGVYAFARYALPWLLTLTAQKLGISGFNMTIIAAIFGAAWIMDTVGLSNALGAFMVGMLLSSSLFADQVRASVSSLKGLLLGVFFIAIGMSINLREVVAMGPTLLHLLPLLFLIKIIVVMVAAIPFRLGLRASVLAGLLLAPFDEIGYIIFSSAYSSGLLSDRAYALGLTMISISFVMSPVLINVGYKLADLFTKETKPDLSLGDMSESIHDHVIVVGYSFVGRVICMMLERADIAYIAFEVSLDRLAEAKKWNHNVHYGDVTDPAMMGALAISNARAVVVTTSDYAAVKRITVNLREFYPGVKVVTAVPYLFQRDELQLMGAAQVVALSPEGTLSFGKTILDTLGADPDQSDTIINSLRSNDYATVRNIVSSIDEEPPGDSLQAESDSSPDDPENATG